MPDEKGLEPPSAMRRPRPLSAPAQGLEIRREDLVIAEVKLAEATRRGDILAALRITNDMIRMDPASAEHHYNKALLCQHQSEIELAVNEFMHAIWLEPDGPYSDYARNSLEDLDVFQLNQIAILANEDIVFRTKLSRNCQEAVLERGFALSPIGEQLLREYCEDKFVESPASPRASRYQ